MKIQNPNFQNHSSFLKIISCQMCYLYSEINVIGSIDRTSDYGSTMQKRYEYSGSDILLDLFVM